MENLKEGLTSALKAQDALRTITGESVKGAADTDNYACSSGIKVGNDPLYLLSSISTDKPALENSLTSCSIVRSGTQDAIYRHMPCPRTSVIIKLAARTTYQACVHTAIAVAAMSVGFTWHLDSPGKTRRDLGEKPLSELFTVVGNSTASDGFRIVIGNGN
ncbi:hypothetical protein EG327_008278 [Venturia inaequalis]|uniref:Uncharacterized protein n=1 Tax=Venturia inaequalis TaxID=5025 RepID=A0A8H3USX2_VENIN|nr:hypothetical protein EG327_008278 [Venturia inaequalis]